MKKCDYKRYLKVATAIAAITCGNCDIPSIHAQSANGVTDIYPQTEDMEKTLSKRIEMRTGQQQIRMFTDQFARFYGLDGTLVEELFVSHYSNIVGSNNLVDDFMGIIENNIALGTILPTATINLELANRDQTRINEVKNSEMGALFQKYCTRYGIDINLVLAQFMQESGLKHDEFNSEAAYGVTQIENTLFSSTVEVYNFETNGYETIEITEDKALDLESNIQIGVAKIQEKMRDYCYNVYMGLQSYNYGSAMFNHVLGHYEERTNQSREALISTLAYSDWEQDVQYIHENPARYTKEKNFQNGATYGDDQYISHVLGYLGTPFLTYRTLDGNSLYVNLSTGTTLSTGMVAITPEMDEYIASMKGTKEDVEKRMVR